MCGHCGATDVMPCQSPEYARLKDASKAELREVYCSAMRKEALNKQFSADARATGRSLAEQGLYNPKYGNDAIEYVRAASACGVVAGEAADWLSKRFRAKPPASCD